LNAFANLPNTAAGLSLDELGSAARHAFDIAYLRACGFSQPDEKVLELERNLRALAGERIERRLSVMDAQISRRKVTNVGATIDAYAARLAAQLEPHPDPRTFLSMGDPTEPIAILAEPEGPIEVGTELFNQGEVLTRGICIARTRSIMAGQFVRGVLLVEPDLPHIDVPVQPGLVRVVTIWNTASRVWHEKFLTALERVLIGIDDQRTRKSIEQRALKLLHAL
jgi:hypothetical protein